MFFIKPSSHQILPNQRQTRTKKTMRGKLEHQNSNIRRSTKCTSHHSVSSFLLCSLTAKWDKNKFKYKIVNSVREDKTIDDLDQYIFIVQNQLDKKYILNSHT
ncbi:hypothetical protein I7I48_05396 [Histoplasma ohiense]|nr:hypothetical protein I7I48_05396 [Histoplasma ohiense (nom. inval.)]